MTLRVPPHAAKQQARFGRTSLSAEDPLAADSPSSFATPLFAPRGGQGDRAARHRGQAPGTKWCAAPERVDRWGTLAHSWRAAALRRCSARGGSGRQPGGTVRDSIFALCSHELKSLAACVVDRREIPVSVENVRSMRFAHPAR